MSSLPATVGGKEKIISFVHFDREKTNNLTVGISSVALESPVLRGGRKSRDDPRRRCVGRRRSGS